MILMIQSNLQHECQARTTRVQQRYESNTSPKLATQVRHECYTNDMSATRVKNFDFDNDTSKNIFSHPYINYIASERLHGEKQFHSQNNLLEMSRFHAKMHLKVHHKTKFFNGKSYIKRLYTRLQPQIPLLPHSYAH